MKRVHFYYRGYICTMRPTTGNNVSLGIFGRAPDSVHLEGADDEQELGKELDSCIIRSRFGAKRAVALAKRQAMKYIDARQTCWQEIGNEGRCW